MAPSVVAQSHRAVVGAAAAEEAAAAAAKTDATDLRKQLDTKSEEVTKFVEGVEGELNSAREDVQRLTEELCVVHGSPRTVAVARFFFLLAIRSWNKRG